ncbi:MAG: RNase adapter RapZ [Desulfotomaculales bacterium]
MIVPRLVIVTGLSGAGRTQALRHLEDMGFFCVDNLPPTLIPKFTELCTHSTRPIDRVALAVDIRGGEFFDALFEILNDLDKSNTRYEILFLEASDETLVRRFKESRRSHPLSVHGEILNSIKEERTRLLELRGRADKIIDTSSLTTQQLKEQLKNLFAAPDQLAALRITIVSFGYKYGVPLDSDLVFDVRFLPNPHYDTSLRPLTGDDIQVEQFVLSSSVTSDFLEKFFNLIEFLLPEYSKEGKSTLTIAIGCTGGQHRSVVIANQLGRHLAEKNYTVTVRHRDLNRFAGD